MAYARDYYTIFRYSRGVKRFFFEQLPLGLLVAVFGLIVVHAPLTVWLGTVFPDQAVAIKAWKEVLIAIAAILVGAQLWRQGALAAFMRRQVVVLVALYAVLHVAMIGIYPQPFQATVAGLLIDLRYVAFFAVMYGFLTLYPRYKRLFVYVGIVGACVVVGFAALQLALPKDALSAIGYGDATIEPYLTVDKNPDFVRYSSTLRGPNPLGAYAAIVLVSVFAYSAFAKKRAWNWRTVAVGGLLTVGSLVALWVSYSRSALLGAGIALAVVAAVRFWRKLRPRTWLIIAGGIAALALTTYVVKDTTFFQNVIMHNNPTTGAAIDSNAAHAESLIDGLRRMAVQPLGAGVGSTGSASLFSGSSVIIENQYLMIAHEVGWAGLAVFLLLFLVVMKELWARRTDWLALAVFASGLGLAFIGLLLPVWADDTVSIIWWGLAAISLIGGEYGKHPSNKKAKRTA